MVTLVEYPKVGSVVNFIRHVNGTTQEGKGVVLAICLDPTKRLSAHIEVMEGNNGLEVGAKVNADLKSLDYSSKYAGEFIRAHEAIKAISAEGNGKIQAIVADYNQRVEDALTAVIGSPITFG